MTSQPSQLKIHQLTTCDSDLFPTEKQKSFETRRANTKPDPKSKLVSQHRKKNDNSPKTPIYLHHGFRGFDEQGALKEQEGLRE